MMGREGHFKGRRDPAYKTRLRDSIDGYIRISNPSSSILPHSREPKFSSIESSVEILVPENLYLGIGSVFGITLQAVTNAVRSVEKRVGEDNKFGSEVMRLKEIIAAVK